MTLVYATADGEPYLRKEHAVTGSSGLETPVSLAVERDRLAPVVDPDTRERYASEARRMAADHEPDDVL